MAEREALEALMAEIARLERELADVQAQGTTAAEQSFAGKMDALSRLAGSVAHNFNNALLLIYGYTDFLLSRMPPDGPYYRYLMEIKGAGEDAAALAHQLMTLSGKRVFQPVVINLNGVVKNAEPALRRVAGNAIACEFGLTSKRCLVRVEPSEMEALLVNMAANARDAMLDGGTLTIATDVCELARALPGHPEMTPGQYVTLVVKDTGCGMDAETRQHAFEPFYTTRDPGAHTGLGLFSAFAVVRQAKGAITCESTPGSGTVFTIYLPLADTLPPTMPHAAPVRRAPISKCVLVAEDDDKVRDLLRELLELQGFEVLEAASGPKALEVLDQSGKNIDLLLADIVMPGMDGYTLSVHARERIPDLPVIYMSGYTENDQLREAVQTARAEFLQKPFSPVEFIEKVKQLLGQPAN
jgi:CheY-like chemotaxis protein/nitrogen-specific signal transduction histidine kinase